MDRGVYGILMFALVGAATACFYKGQYHRHESIWVDDSKPSQLSVCECKGWKNVCQKVGTCLGQGDIHYLSFDGNKFNFQGVCRYILVEHIDVTKFQFEIQQVPYSKIASVNEKFTIRFGKCRTVELSKVNILVVDNFVKPSLFYDDPELRCELDNRGRILVTLKNEGIWFRWDWQYWFNVYAVPTLKRHLAGLCGDYNGHPGNDLALTPQGHPHTIPEWGKLWRTQTGQPSRCTSGGRRRRNGKPDIVNPCANYTSTMDKCSSIINSPVFSACRAKVSPASFIADCKIEMCACGYTGTKGCICIGMSLYIQACKDAGVIIGDGWKAQHDCGVCRDPHTKQKYEHGEEWRLNCEVRRCKNGQVTRQIKKCCYERGLAYLYGQTWRSYCQIKKCENGRIVRKSKDPNCCYYQGKEYREGQSWNSGCRVLSCAKGRVSVSTNKNCCRHNKWLFYPKQIIHIGCSSCLCNASRWKCKKRPNCYKTGEPPAPAP